MERHALAISEGFRQRGIGLGSRVVVQLDPGPQFFEVTCALLRIGAVPVFVDGKMTTEDRLRCFEQVRPAGFVGTPMAHALRFGAPRAFDTTHVHVSVGWPRLPKTWHLRELSQEPPKGFHGPALTRAHDPVFIRCGKDPWGVVRAIEFSQEGFFEALTQWEGLLGDASSRVIVEEDPFRAVLSLLLGATVVVVASRDLDPSVARRGELWRLLSTLGINTLAGSCRHLQSLLDSETATHLPSPSPSLVVCIDSTPRPEILHPLRERLAPGTRMLLTFASLETPFVTSAIISPFRKTPFQKTPGATSQPGESTCVGRGLRGIEVEVIPATSACIPRWHEQLPLDIGVIGEVVVRSKSVCTGYVDDVLRTASSKIVDHPLPWHRTGHLGAFDQEGQLWLFGPKPHRPGPRIPTLDSRTSLRAHRPSPAVTASLSSIPQAFADLR